MESDPTYFQVQTDLVEKLKQALGILNLGFTTQDMQPLQIREVFSTEVPKGISEIAICTETAFIDFDTGRIVIAALKRIAAGQQANG